MKARAAAEIWADDRLGRREDAQFLATFLRNRSRELAERGEQRSYVLNLDARWGQGKTFFLERMQEELAAAGHLAVYVNAWRDDFADDPLVAVMAAIDEEVQRHTKPQSKARKAWAAAKTSGGKIAKEVGKGLLRRGISLVITKASTEAIEATVAEGSASAEALGAAASATADETASAIDKVLDRQAEKSVSSFQSSKRSIETFRSNLADFVVQLEQAEGKAAPMFVLLDELDRCRPPYAIAMLERIKHLFEPPNVVFIVATDSSQLVHAIGAVYGHEFEAGRYLKRFFDRTYTFERQSPADLVKYLLQQYPLAVEKLSSPLEDDHEALIANFFHHAGTDLRSINQIYDILRSLVTTWNAPPRLELVLLLPMIAAYHAGNTLDEPTLANAEFVPNLGRWAMPARSTSGSHFERGEVKAVAVATLIQELWTALGKGDLYAIISGQNNSRDTVRDWIRRRCRRNSSTVTMAGSLRPITPIPASFASILGLSVKPGG